MWLLAILFQCGFYYTLCLLASLRWSAFENRMCYFRGMWNVRTKEYCCPVASGKDSQRCRLSSPSEEPGETKVAEPMEVCLGQCWGAHWGNLKCMMTKEDWGQVIMSSEFYIKKLRSFMPVICCAGVKGKAGAWLKLTRLWLVTSASTVQLEGAVLSKLYPPPTFSSNVWWILSILVFSRGLQNLILLLFLLDVTQLEKNKKSMSNIIQRKVTFLQ